MDLETTMNKKQTFRMAVHGIAPRTTTTGPGERFTIWVQGCKRLCPGCHNPDMIRILEPDAPAFKAPSTPGWLDIPELLQMIREENHRKPLEGITISGGEPFDQKDALHALLIGARKLEMGIIVFTGFTKEELMDKPEGRRFFRPETMMDILVDGPYDREKRLDGPLRVSSNQRMILLSERYQENDLSLDFPLECFVDSDGSVIYTGFTPPPIAIG